MLAGLHQRASRRHLTAIIEPHLCEADKINIPVPLDFALTFWMVHEVRQPQALLTEIYTALKPGGHYLLVEPLVHVSGPAFAATVALAQAVGFDLVEPPAIALSRAVLFRR
jgi:SAM-dependent methyltransferase